MGLYGMNEGIISHTVPASPIYYSVSHTNFDIQQIALNNLSTTFYVALGNPNLYKHQRNLM